MGRKTYDESRKEWIDEGFYPSSAASNADSTLVEDRTTDWCCSMHGKDPSGKRTISDPGTKRVVDTLVSLLTSNLKSYVTLVLNP